MSEPKVECLGELSEVALNGECPVTCPLHQLCLNAALLHLDLTNRRDEFRPGFNLLEDVVNDPRSMDLSETELEVLEEIIQRSSECNPDLDL